jgi:ATP-dependent Clp protease ATP-binding subunit ClpC
MNESALLKLKVIVERAVRPVQATISRKKKMREELLANVTGVFEDELPRCGNEATALIQVEKRFGDLGELSRTLQQSVPNNDVFNRSVERLIKPRIGQSLVQRAGLCGMIVFAFNLILVQPLFYLIIVLHGGEIGIFSDGNWGYWIGMPIHSVFWGIHAFIGTLLANRLERLLFGTSERSLSTSTSFAFLVTYLLLVLPGAFGTSHGMSWGTPNLHISLLGLSLFHMTLIWVANLISSEKLYRDEWSQLQID